MTLEDTERTSEHAAERLKGHDNYTKRNEEVKSKVDTTKYADRQRFASIPSLMGRVVRLALRLWIMAWSLLVRIVVR